MSVEWKLAAYCEPYDDLSVMVRMTKNAMATNRKTVAFTVSNENDSRDTIGATDRSAFLVPGGEEKKQITLNRAHFEVVVAHCTTSEISLCDDGFFVKFTTKNVSLMSHDSIEARNGAGRE